MKAFVPPEAETSLIFAAHDMAGAFLDAEPAEPRATVVRSPLAVASPAAPEPA